MEGKECFIENTRKSEKKARKQIRKGRENEGKREKIEGEKKGRCWRISENGWLFPPPQVLPSTVNSVFCNHQQEIIDTTFHLQVLADGGRINRLINMLMNFIAGLS